MLTKEQFINAMEFFNNYDEIRESITSAVEKFFDGHGLLFKGCDGLHDKYLKLLSQAMDLEPDDDIIGYFLYEKSNNIYSEPNASGLCEKIGEADYEFVKVTSGEKEFIIKDADDLYEYIKYSYDR